MLLETNKQTHNISYRLQAIPSSVLLYSEGTYIQQAEDMKLKIYLNHNFKKLQLRRFLQGPYHRHCAITE